MPSNPSTSEQNDDEMLPEYNFDVEGAVRGKYYKKYRAGHTVEIRHTDGSVTVRRVPPQTSIELAPDVREYFPDEESVNTALRTLIALVQRKSA